MRMKFRKKSHKNESEVYTDSLNDILFILLMLFLIVSTVANPNIVKVANPKGSKNTKAKQDIVITLDKDQNYFLGQNKFPKKALTLFYQLRFAGSEASAGYADGGD
ncbi:MAG: biopolymer transporter ExbD [Chitinophagaceae bacterium]|nr:biopolymer transporter ExbD [Chitinophagaceae bacterium]